MINFTIIYRLLCYIIVKSLCLASTRLRTNINYHYGLILNILGSTENIERKDVVVS